MIRRLLCFLLCVAIGFTLLSSTSAVAQTTAKTEKKATPVEGDKPNKEKQVDDKKSSAKKDSPKPVVATEKAAAKKASAKKATAEKAVAEIQSKNLLPVSTRAWFSVPNVGVLEKKFEETQFGQLAKDPTIKPFVDSFRAQAKGWLEEKNVRLGLQVEDLAELDTGEICLAGVMQARDGGKPARGSHGMVMLVEVGDSADKAKQLLEKATAQLVKNRNAVREQIKINSVSVSKTTIKNPKRLRHSQVSFQVIHNGWLLAADNEDIFRDVMKRLANPNGIRKETTLANQEAFQQIRTHSQIESVTPHVSWYVDIFGYIELAQAIADEEKDTRPHKNDWAAILKDEGLDGIRGVGGNISLSTGKHEMLHREFIYVPRDKVAKVQKRVYGLFDFSSDENGSPQPAAWVPANVSGYFSANWNFTKLLGSIGHFYDAFLEEGDFERMIKDFKVDPDMQLDIKKLVGMLGNQVTVISTTERPITEDSERVVIGLKINGDTDFVFKSIRRAIGRGNSEMIKLAGFDVIKVEAVEEEDLGTEIDLPELPGIDEESDEDEDEEGEEPEFSLFEKKYFVMHKGHLLIANDKNYLKKLLVSKQKVALNETEDYQQIADSLSKLTNKDRVSFRQFGRVDRALETNYEMLRSGKMGNSRTVMAKILNKAFQQEFETEAEKKDREQKLDGSKLPKNYAESIAPYLGPTGWVMETEKDGWRVTGCLLKKKSVSDVVEKVGGTKPKNPKR